MLRVIFILLPILALIGGVVGWYWAAPVPLAAGSLPSHEPDPVNGERMFYAGGCIACHAAPGAEGEDKLILAGGLELKTEFGSFFAPNISPNTDVGIGRWSMLDFVSAMTRGVSPRGHHYFPSFPYASYARMKVTDVMDLKAFIDTLPGSFNIEPRHKLSFPYNIRRGVGAWKHQYFDPSPVMTGLTDPLAQRGQYLVEGPGHCGECHTPRDAFGGPDLTRWLGGAPNPEGKGRIPNITPHEGALGSWSADDIAYYLETGFTPEFDSAGGAMVAVIDNISKLPPEDRAAIAAYLKAVPPVTPEAAPASAADGG